MIYSISGKMLLKKPDFAVIEANGLGFRIRISKATEKLLPGEGEDVRLFCSLHVGRDNLELLGFIDERERDIFGTLTSINGIGPRGAMKILGVGDLEQILASIESGKAELLTKAAGIGRKKAERIILELRDKFKESEDRVKTAALYAHRELEGVLRALGYKEREVREVVPKISLDIIKLEDQMKMALKMLAKK